MPSEDSQPAETFDSWSVHPAIEIEPTTDSLSHPAIARCFSRCHGVLEDSSIDWRLMVHEGECLYHVAAEEDTLDRVEPILREALSQYALTRTDGVEPVPLNQDSLVGVEYEGHGARSSDWQTGLRPLVNEDDHSDAQTALTSAVDALANIDATVVYQTLVTAKSDWTAVADARCWDLEENRDTRGQRFGDFLFGVTGEQITERETEPTHLERIDRIRAAETRHTFDVATRAVACGPQATDALDALSGALSSASGEFYRLVPKPADEPTSLVAAMVSHSIPRLSWWPRFLRVLRRVRLFVVQGDVLAMDNIECTLSLVNCLRCSVQVSPGHGEKAARLVQFHVVSAIPAPWERSFHDDVHASPRWADLCIGVQAVDDGPRPRLDRFGCWNPTVVQVDADERVVVGEDEAKTEIFSTGCCEGIVERTPGRRISRRGEPPCLWVEWNLRRSTVALLLTPADPLVSLAQSNRDVGRSRRPWYHRNRRRVSPHYSADFAVQYKTLSDSTPGDIGGDELQYRHPRYNQSTHRIHRSECLNQQASIQIPLLNCP
ncbi:hypothetical protein ACFPYI_12145 [Halomarina salina]|uniref:Uncharacterized protein n=1 Tax=Halomarina salina TaxID=1872699 RepID=A0ABD5RNF8_9EURY|nr:hypothetical protein [Halomarina salina]